MRFPTVLLLAVLVIWTTPILAYVPGKTPDGADRHWASGTISVQLTGPASVDGHAVQDSVRNAMATWNAVGHSSIHFSAAATIGGGEPTIGNGKNELGWVERSDSPYFIPGVPCTTAYIYDTLTGIMVEADTTCDAMSFQWPPNLFGLATQNAVADAETWALAAFGTWLGLDASLQFDDPMYPVPGSGRVARALLADELAFARHVYGDGASQNGSIHGNVRFPDGSPVPYAYVIGTDGAVTYGAVADATGAYSLVELVGGYYSLVARPLTTDPSVESSAPYRSNAIRNLDFSPELYAGGTLVRVENGSTAWSVDVVASRSGSQPDRNEPNDAAGSATPLTIGYSKVGTMHTALDRDWYQFQTQPGTCYVVSTTFHGASIVPVPLGEAFWSRTSLALYDGPALVGYNQSRDEAQGDPGSWLTYCETGAGRPLNVEVAQREGGSGAGFFYSIWVQALTDGTSRTPAIDRVYPNAGWANQERYVWIGGAGFMPGATVAVRVPSGAWVTSTDVAAVNCDASYQCAGLKALLPPAGAGLADVKVENPNGRSVTSAGAYTYQATGQGPIVDGTPAAFGVRGGFGRAVCIGDYDGDGADDIFKSRTASLPNQLFHNNGDGTFTDVAASAGVYADPVLLGQSCSFVDVDDDGDLDLYTTNYKWSAPGGSTNELYINKLKETGSAYFVRSTPAGLEGASGRYQSDAAWADFDKDGLLDVVLADNSYSPNAPYHDAIHYMRQNAWGGFTDVTAYSGLAGYVADVHWVTAADFDLDGCDDLLFLTGSGTMNRMYRGNCRGQFVDVTALSHIAGPSTWCKGYAVADFNNDGRPDIFCGAYNAGTAPGRPKLWINNGGMSFTDRAYEAGLWSVARNMDVILPFDEDNDGRIDVYIGASETSWPDDRKDVLLQNTGGSPVGFQDVTGAASMYPTTADGSGYCGPGVDEFYCDRDAAAGGVFDWYGDGALDVFVTGTDPDGLQRSADFLWRNRRDVTADGSIAPDNDWIEIALQGANTPASRVLSSRSGIGAKVTVIPRFNLFEGRLPTETECLQNPLPPGVSGTTREVLVGSHSQSTTTLHFGLGSTMPRDRKIVDCVKVVWPSGLERAYTGVLANSRVVLAENIGHVKVLAVVPNNGSNTRSDPTTIVGLHFDRDVAEVPQVFFGAVPVRSVTFVSEHELVVLPPLWQPPGTVSVTVVDTDGARDTLLAAYTYTGSDVYVRFKDPVPSLLGADGAIVTDPNTLAQGGIERTGVIADGVTELVFEAETATPGSVCFVLDDDDLPGNSPPAGAGVGTLTALGGGPAQTSLTVDTVTLADGRHVAYAIYTAPQDFIRSAADRGLASRPIQVRASFIDASRVEVPMPGRTLELHRVPILIVHGMWGDTTSFGWPVLDDPRFIVHRADYKSTNDRAFAQNAGMPPRTIAELRRRINDLGIAGTRFLVIAHSMGAVLFKIYMSGAGRSYARPDNFFAGDVYALIPVDAPLFGAYLAPFMRYVESVPALGPHFIDAMAALDMPIDRGCMESLDPNGPDILEIPSASGTFHGIVGWGGREMRSAGIDFPEAQTFAALESVLLFFDVMFEAFPMRCGSGDDFIVCAESQAGGLASAHTDNFHYRGLSSKAIHFDSICLELDPSAAAERLLNTPSADESVWGHVLPQAPLPARVDDDVASAGAPSPAQTPGTSSDAPPIRLDKQGDGVVITWTGTASRLLKSLAPTLATGVCVAVTGASFTDAHALTVPTSAYYQVGGDGLCVASGALSVSAVDPAAGSALGGYRVTVWGSGFAAGARVQIGGLFAAEVVVVSPTTLTCKAPPGQIGATSITVIDASGASASSSFVFTAPGPAIGSVRITSPENGAIVTAGSTLTVTAEGAGGFSIDRGLVVGPGFASGIDLDPGESFAARVTLPVATVGPVAIHLVARDTQGNVQSAEPLTIDVVVAGNASFQRLDAAPVTMLYASPTAQLRVYGIYSDGVRRELTHVPGLSFEMDTQDARKPNFPYNGTGVATVDATGLVTAKSQGSTLCHVTYEGRTIDVVVEVDEIRPSLTLQKPGFVSWPYQGPGVSYDLVRGNLAPLRTAAGRFTDPSVGLTCLKNDFTNVTAADPSNPQAGDGFFYLMRDSRSRSYDESPFWATRSQVGQRTGVCP